MEFPGKWRVLEVIAGRNCRQSDGAAEFSALLESTSFLVTHIVRGEDLSN